MIWEFFWRFLFSKRAGSVVRRVSWLSITALTLSVAALILVLSVMTALNRNMQSRLLAIEPHLVIEAKTGPEWSAIEKAIRDRKLIRPEWRSFPFEAQDVIVRTAEGRFRGAYARGLTPEGLEFISGEIDRINKGEPRKRALTPFVATGDVLKERERLEAGEVLIGVDLAYVLGVFEGDSLTLVPPEGLLLPSGEAPKFEKVRAREILTTNLQDFDAQGIFYIQGKTLPSFARSASLRRGLEIWLPDIGHADATKERLTAALKDQAIRISTWKERNSALFLSLRLEKTMIGLFLSVAAIIAGFSLIIALGLLISQKRREIGLLQAIGLSRQRCFQLFQGLALRLSGLGVGMGLLIGGSLSLYMERHPLKILPDIYYDAEVPAYVDFRFLLTIGAVAFVLTFVGGLLVTRPLAEFQPVDLLKTRK